jgi:hypothetical protein
MIVFYALGLILVALAFFAAATETATTGLSGTQGLFISALDLWQARAPDSLEAARAAFEEQGLSGLWDPVLTTILFLPAWLVLGAPGMALIIICRPPPQDAMGVETAIDEDSLSLYDRLAEAAEEEDFEYAPPTLGHDYVPAESGYTHHEEEYAKRLHDEENAEEREEGEASEEDEKGAAGN